MRPLTTAFVLCLGATACNQVFGLRETQSIDAQRYDAAPDAPFTCPAGNPTFSKELHQPILQRCSGYTPSTTGYALADCAEPTPGIAQGPIDEPLDLAPGLQSTGTVTLAQPRLTPEGDEAFVVWHDSTVLLAHIQRFRRNGDNTWTFESEIPLTLSAGVTLGSPSRGPSRRIMVLYAAAVHELAEDNGIWTDHATYTAQNLGVAGFYSCPNLTADGLRIVLYSQRPTDPGPIVLYA
ncbi:MAG TPA: hypothetical protein VLB44_12145, partial [Kofleriaceae bacterium]|nr:hypothetical protein [Kofleriaceae bacterium]